MKNSMSRLIHYFGIGSGELRPVFIHDEKACFRLRCIRSFAGDIKNEK